MEAILDEHQYDQVYRRAQRIYCANRGSISRSDAVIRALEQLEDFIDDISEGEFDDIVSSLI